MEQIQELDLTGELIEEQGDAQDETQIRRKASPIAVLLIGAVVVIAIVFGLALVRANQTQPTEGIAPDFTLSTFTGETFKLSELRGKVVVLNFWASWCGPCRYEAPALEATWQRYKDRGVVFVGIAYTDTERAAIAFLKEYGVSYANGLDLGTKISEMYRIQGVPETFFIDRKGNIVEFVKAPLSEAGLRAIIERVLAS